MSGLDVKSAEEHHRYRYSNTSEDGLDLQRDYTPEEEKAAKRKLDLIIMPLLTLGFFCLRESGFVLEIALR